jgi:hypothetical protein
MPDSATGALTGGSWPVRPLASRRSAAPQPAFCYGNKPPKLTKAKLTDAETSRSGSPDYISWTELEAECERVRAAAGPCGRDAQLQAATAVAEDAESGRRAIEPADDAF